MKNATCALAALALLCVAPPLFAQSKTKSAGGSMTWLGLDLGLLSGSVDVPCQGSGSNCSEGGVFGSSSVNFTVAGPAAFRLRAVRAEEYTQNRPYELAALGGGRIGRRWYGLIGVGVIKNVDDDYDRDATGLAWEFLYARRSRSSVGFEFSFHGNYAKDVSYAGISFGLRLGDLN